MWECDTRFIFHRQSFSKCTDDFNVMFISIQYLNTDDDSTFSIIMIDPMQQPEKTLKFDKSTISDNQKWIQVRNSNQSTRSQNIVCGVAKFFSAFSWLNSCELSRTEAIFEYSSSSKNHPFKVYFECRHVELHGLGSTTLNHIWSMLYICGIKYATNDMYNMIHYYMRVEWWIFESDFNYLIRILMDLRHEKSMLYIENAEIIATKECEERGLNFFEIKYFWIDCITSIEGFGWKIYW